MQDIGLQHQKRIDWVLDHIGYGKSCRDEYQKKFGLSQYQFYADRKEALTLLKERVNDDVDKWKDDIIERLEELYARSINSPRTYNVALNTLQTLAKITGNLEEKVKVEAVIPQIRWEKESDE